MSNTASKIVSYSSPEGTKDGEEAPGVSEVPAVIPWPTFIQTATYEQIRARFATELIEVVKPFKNTLKTFCCVTVIAPSSEDSVSEFYADRVFAALREANPKKDKDVLLILVTRGGSIEPAFQISKLCKSYSKTKFTVVVPRRAKSAGTLIAIGADQVHIGPLGQLGPIDPQLRGLPALGVAPALERIASLSERYPGSADMFARYLRLTLAVEEIGYYERISQSAAQYAERLLSTKAELGERKTAIANELVYAFKDHGFVIDYDEAQKILGQSWVLNNSPELDLAEAVYKLFEEVDLWLTIVQKKRLLLIGALKSEPLIFDNKKA